MTIAAMLRTKGSEVETIGAEEGQATPSRRLGRTAHRRLPVVEGERIAGIISERDIIYCLRDHGAEVLDWPVWRMMTSPAITVEPDRECCRHWG